MRVQSPRQGEKGIALIIVMLVIVALSALVLDFSSAMKVEMRLAQNVEAEREGVWVAHSGMEYAAWILAETSLLRRGRPHHSLNQFWAGGIGELEEIETFAGHRMKDIELGSARIKELTIVDTERRINITMATPEMLERAVELLGFDTLEASTVTESIVEWRNRRRVVAGGRGGDSEESFYTQLPVPYRAKYAPIDDLSELLLVRGVTPEMFWGRSHPAALKRSRMSAGRLALPWVGGARADGMATGTGEGLIDIFAAQGVGRVNINTASAAVLQLLPGIDPATAESIVAFRAGPDHVSGTEDDTPFESVGELASIGSLPPQLIQGLGSVCAVVSTVFEVRVAIEHYGFQRVYVGTLRSAGGRTVQAVTGHWE